MPKKLQALWAALSVVALAGCDDSVAPGLSRSSATKIETAIKMQLKDPQSLQIDWVPYDQSMNYCATYNSKNSLGGYVGRHRFAAFVVPENGNIKSVSGVVLETDANAGSPATNIVCDAYLKLGVLPSR
jgi:hypothetical protein